MHRRQLRSLVFALFLGTAQLTTGCFSQAAQDYKVRTNFGQALNWVNQVRVGVAMYRLDRGSWPKDIDEAVKDDPVPPMPTKLIQAISIDGDGRLTVTFKANLDGLGSKSFTMTPTVEPNGLVRWNCTAPDIPPRYRTQSCR